MTHKHNEKCSFEIILITIPVLFFCKVFKYQEFAIKMIRNRSKM